MATYKGRNLALSVGGNVIVRARDCTITRTTNVIDATSRNSGNDEQVEYGIRSTTIAADIVADSGDSSITALNTAYAAQTKVAVSVGTAFGTQTGTGVIEDLSEDQPYTDIVKLSLSVRMDGALS